MSNYGDDSTRRDGARVDDGEVRMRSRSPLPPARGDRDASEAGASRARSRSPPRTRRYEPPAPRRPPHAPAAAPNNVLGVFGLSIRTTERDLSDEFSRSGPVDKVVVVYDARTDRSRGFGFVTMADLEGAERAINDLNGVELHGRRIRVDFSATKRAHDPTPGQYRGVRRDDDDVLPPRRTYGGGRDDDRWASSSSSRGGGGGGDDRWAPRGGSSRRDDYSRRDDRRDDYRRDDRGGGRRDYGGGRDRSRSRSPPRRRRETRSPSPAPRGGGSDRPAPPPRDDY